MTPERFEEVLIEMEDEILSMQDEVNMLKRVFKKLESFPPEEIPDSVPDSASYWGIGEWETFLESRGHI